MSPLSILLIEDNPAHRCLFEEYLRLAYQSSYALTNAETLEMALGKLEEASFDLIVLDLSLPDAHRLEGLQEIVKKAPTIPVVVHSSLEDEVFIEEAVKKGAQDYLVKGKYDTDLLIRVFRYAIERQQSLIVVQDSEKRLRSIIEHTSDGVVIVGPDELILFANPAAECLFDTKLDDLLGTPIDFPLIADGITELEVTDKLGRDITIEMRVSPIRWEGQDAFLASLRDITPHKQLEDFLTEAKIKAEDLARMKSSFLASMSHELRTPLTGILGFADTLVRELESGQHQKFAGIIKDAGQRLLKTINSILDLSQLEAGVVQVEQEIVQVSEVAQEVLALLSPLSESNGLSLGLTSMTPQARIEVDRHLLQRILENLVGNAIKFTESGGVTVSVEADKEQVFIRIEDTGIGIDPSFLPFLFDEFSQESSGMSRKHEGSGLGLAITKKLVDLMGGELEVTSEVGVGTAITLTFARAQTSRGAMVPHSDRSAHPLRPKVLVAEDNNQTQELIKHILAPHFDVTLVPDGDTALAHLQTTRYDALVLDIHLEGEKTGVDVLQEARTRTAHRETPAVAVTAYASRNDERFFIEEAGFNAFASKPFTSQQLLQTVQHAMGPSFAVAS